MGCLLRRGGSALLQSNQLLRCWKPSVPSISLFNSVAASALSKEIIAFARCFRWIYNDPIILGKALISWEALRVRACSVEEHAKEFSAETGRREDRRVRCNWRSPSLYRWVTVQWTVCCWTFVEADEAGGPKTWVTNNFITELVRFPLENAAQMNEVASLLHAKLSLNSQF
jgi:hypothetical protein